MARATLQTMVSLRRRLFVTGTLCVLGAFMGCLSPTLPLPPPSQPEVTAPDENGEVVLSGAVLPDSEALATNLRTNEIRGQFTRSGFYEIRLPAVVGDEISVFYIHESRLSPSKVVTVRAP
jgi:hypothetical protein